MSSAASAGRDIVGVAAIEIASVVAELEVLACNVTFPFVFVGEFSWAAEVVEGAGEDAVCFGDLLRFE